MANGYCTLAPSDIHARPSLQSPPKKRERKEMQKGTRRMNDGQRLLHPGSVGHPRPSLPTIPIKEKREEGMQKGTRRMNDGQRLLHPGSVGHPRPSLPTIPTKEKREEGNAERNEVDERWPKVIAPWLRRTSTPAPPDNPHERNETAWNVGAAVAG